MSCTSPPLRSRPILLATGSDPFSPVASWKVGTIISSLSRAAGASCFPEMLGSGPVGWRTLELMGPSAAVQGVIGGLLRPTCCPFFTLQRQGGGAGSSQKAMFRPPGLETCLFPCPPLFNTPPYLGLCQHQMYRPLKIVKRKEKSFI